MKFPLERHSFAPLARDIQFFLKYIHQTLLLVSSVCIPITQAQSINEPQLPPHILVEQKAFPEYSTGITWKQLAQDTHSHNVILRKRILPSTPSERRSSTNVDKNALPAHVAQELFASDEAAIVTFSRVTSFLTANNEFTFADYDGLVEKVLGKNDVTSLNPGCHIVVSRPGGTVRTNSYTITGVDPGFPPYLLNQRYLLFLRRIPGTDSYRATARGSYILTPNGVVPLERHQNQGSTSALAKVGDAPSSPYTEDNFVAAINEHLAHNAQVKDQRP